MKNQQDFELMHENKQPCAILWRQRLRFRIYGSRCNTRTK
jgi:hypothetical protein